MSDITILMPTYNKEKYISKALDSILAQKTTYSMEILIADDCSTDNTLNIVNSYKNRTNIKIEVLTSTSNQGLYFNIIRAYKYIKTNYFTVLDPDDYWCDNYKIQDALNFLEANNEFTIYSSNIFIKDGKSIRKYFKDKKPYNFGFNDFLKQKHFVGQTSGTIFRNVIFFNGIPEKISELESNTKKSSFRGDSFRNIIHLHEGLCHYDPKCRSVYQITEEGIWTSSSNFTRELLNANLCKDMFLYFDKKYIELLQQSFDIYKSIMKKIYIYLSQDNINLTNIFNNLNELQELYTEYKDRLYFAKENKNFLKHIFIFIVQKLYNRLICYMQ